MSLTNLMEFKKEVIMGEKIKCPECGEEISEFVTIVMMHCFREHDIKPNFNEMFHYKEAEDEQSFGRNNV